MLTYANMYVIINLTNQINVTKHLGGMKMKLKQLERLLAGEKVEIKNGRISLDNDWFVVEKKVEENFIAIDGFKNLELALKSLGNE